MVISLMTQLTTLEICYVKSLTLESRTNKETRNVYENFRRMISNDSSHKDHHNRPEARLHERIVANYFKRPSRVAACPIQLLCHAL